MEDVIQTSVSNWHLFLEKISHEVDVFVPVESGVHLEYTLFDTITRPVIRYNKPAPVTPVKTFFLPVKENVVQHKAVPRSRMIVGIPACDLKGLELLDEIYLDEQFPDPVYKRNRENTLLIGTDCFDIHEYCHCTSYGVDPCPATNADATLIALDGELILAAKTPRGSTLINKLREDFPAKEPVKHLLQEAENQRSYVRDRLSIQNKMLPDLVHTGKMIRQSGDTVWQKQAKTCVSCGACATICPTCTCFLLIDRPDFDKFRQMDACQYPGFEKIAAGEDPLHKKPARFRNRYSCKYVWKPERFRSQACTGCGRCIACCIGNINKNSIFTEMMESS